MTKNLPEWFVEGYGNVWLPYTQMQTADDAVNGGDKLVH